MNKTTEKTTCESELIPFEEHTEVFVEDPGKTCAEGCTEGKKYSAEMQ